VQQVTTGGAGRVDADRTLDLGGVVAGVLDRVKRGLQEKPKKSASNSSMPSISAARRTYA
jgi:hypothetical protein